MRMAAGHKLLSIIISYVTMNAKGNEERRGNTTLQYDPMPSIQSPDCGLCDYWISTPLSFTCSLSVPSPPAHRVIPVLLCSPLSIANCIKAFHKQKVPLHGSFVFSRIFKKCLYTLRFLDTIISIVTHLICTDFINNSLSYCTLTLSRPYFHAPRTT